MATHQNNEGPHLDCEHQTPEDLHYFFLDHLLRARIALHCETGREPLDQEINMYVADLLESFSEQGHVHLNTYVSPYDADIVEYLREHPDLRTTFQVYKENADFGLVSSALFSACDHKGSYFARVLAGRDEVTRVACYYKMAASALGHLRGMHETMVQVLYAIAAQIEEIWRLVKKVGVDYFDFIRRLTRGSWYHMEREVKTLVDEKKYKELLDRFLTLFAEYKSHATALRRKVLLEIADQLSRLNPAVSFSEALL